MLHNDGAVGFSRDEPCIPTRNLILNNLPASYLESFVEHLEYVYIEAGQRLFDKGQEVSHAYFPTTSVFSVTEMLRDGTSAEVALIGREGMIGTLRILGGTHEAGRGIVQHPGYAYRMPADTLLREFNEHRALRDPILRFVQMLYIQLSYLIICSGHHTVQQRMCRWFLLIMDRAETDEIRLTHSLIAGFLGVRREGVSLAARDLQRRGVIQYRRGLIKVVDRPALEALSCECYEDLNEATGRMFAESATM